jgi:hypothetical protein
MTPTTFLRFVERTENGKVVRVLQQMFYENGWERWIDVPLEKMDKSDDCRYGAPHDE